MEAVLRAVAVYVVLLLIFRLSGKRTMSQVTTFEFVLLLIIGSATQQALLGEDFSITQAALVIATLIGLSRLADYLGWRFPKFDRITESVPLVLVQDGRVLKEALRKEHLTEDEVLTAARETQGLERLDQIKWAVLDQSGTISVVPKETAPR